MRVPNAAAARVDLEKITAYLLSDAHPIGRIKAKFFKGLGFTPELPGELGWASVPFGLSRAERWIRGL